jgi:uncharacterized membrane protein YdjX (TVP38/TMEM64 family)
MHPAKDYPPSDRIQPVSSESRTEPSRTSALTAVVGVVVLVGLLGAVLLFRRELSALTDPAVLTALVRDAGPAAPVVFFLVQVVQVLVAPIPAPAVSLIGGYLFGPVVGSMLSVAGIAVGSALAFWLARRFGRAAVERFVPAGAIVRFDALTARRGQVGLFVAFLVPGFPDDALCFVGGLTAIPLRRLVAIAVIGRAPTVVALSLVGAGIADGDIALVVVLGGLVVALSLGGYLLRHRVLGGPAVPASVVAEEDAGESR